MHPQILGGCPALDSFIMEIEFTFISGIRYAINIRPAAIWPAGKRHDAILEKQFQPRAAPGSDPAIVRYPVLLQIGLPDVAPGLHSRRSARDQQGLRPAARPGAARCGRGGEGHEQQGDDARGAAGGAAPNTTGEAASQAGGCRGSADHGRKAGGAAYLDSTRLFCHRRGFPLP